MRRPLVLCLLIFTALNNPFAEDKAPKAATKSSKEIQKPVAAKSESKGVTAKPAPFVDSIRRRKFPIREQDKITDVIAQRIVFDTFRRKARKTKDCVDTMGRAERLTLKGLPLKLYREAKEKKQNEAEADNTNYKPIRYSLSTFRFTWYKWKRRNLTRYNELVTINREISCKSTRTVSRAAVKTYDIFAQTGTGISPVEIMDAAFSRLLNVTAPVDGKLCNGNAEKLVPYVTRRKRLNLAVWKAWVKSYPEKFKKAGDTAFDLNCKPKSAALNDEPVNTNSQ